jgi:hypothetical protein
MGAGDLDLDPSRRLKGTLISIKCKTYLDVIVEVGTEYGLTAPILV